MKYKNKNEKKLKSSIKKLNKQLKKDVFRERFYIREIKKQYEFYEDGTHGTYILYELIDREDNKRRKHIWVDEFSASKVYIAMNAFIVTSNFWEKFYAGAYDENGHRPIDYTNPFAIQKAKEKGWL